MATAEEKLFKAFEKTFNVVPKNIYDIMKLHSDDLIDVIDNLLYLEQHSQLKEREEEFKKAVIEAMKEYGAFLIMCEREGRPLLLAEDYYREYFNTKQKDSRY